MTFKYKPVGVCSKEIYVSLLEDNTIESVRFIGGCEGNLSGISKLVAGKNAGDIIKLLRKTTCGYKHTSCPDQLAIALEKALSKSKES
jgi:uncharacterized protein (TIGR03905 family)